MLHGFYIQHCKKRCESTHTVILSVCKHHAAIQTTITCFSCRNNLQFCRKKIFLFHLIILFQQYFITFALTASFSFSSRLSSCSIGRLPISRSSFSPSTTVDAFFSICFAARWISRSVITKTGSSSFSPMLTFTTVPSFFAITPCSASGSVTH